MSWNHRVVRHGQNSYQIHEVYYKDDGSIRDITMRGVAPFGETADALRAELLKMLRAHNEPVIDYTTFEELPDVE